LRKLFPKVFEFSDDAQDEAKRNGCVKDYFSRVRYFENNYYKARNFVVQSPAALLCLEKLVRLHQKINKEEAKIVFSVHDGYGITASKANALTLYPQIKSVLESKSSFLPNCNLEVSFKIGKRLDNLLELKRKETVLS
jgi:DNA polymerase I-like protein with 3'-5' exonuclease and polymerase domains